MTLPASKISASPGRNPEKKVGIALLGLGYYAEHKLATGLEETKNCYLAGIVTGTPSKVEKWKKKYNLADKNIYNYENFDKIANNPDIQAVYVVTPNSLHKEFVIRAAKAGKHVICEKPMAISSQECQEMINACKAANVKLYVGYRLHFEPYTQEAMRVGQKKVFGNVKVVESNMGFKIGDPTQWRLKKAMAGGGAMMDVGIYAIQGARYSTGLEPMFVTAQEYKTDPVKFKEVDETIFWQMEFPDGSVSNSMTSYACSMERLFISAENGWLEMAPAFSYGPIEGRTSNGPMNFPKVNHQALMLDGMALGILENKPNTATGEEGMRDMKIIEAIYRAVQSGKKEKI
jgi:predicted dehydrogenase